MTKVWKIRDVAGAADLNRWENSAVVFKVSADDDINAAITAAAAFAPVVRLQLAPGAVYSVSASVNGASNVHIDGNGATLKWVATTGDRPLFFNAVSNARVSDLTVDCGSTPPQSAIFALNSQVRFGRVKIVSTATTGAGFRLSGCTNSRIEWCDVQGTANAFNITGLSKKCKIIGGTATGTLAGVLINPSGTSAPSDIDVSGVTVSDFPIDANGNPTAVLGYAIRSAGTSAAHNKNIRFTLCTVEGVQGHGYIDGGTPGGTADQINAVYTDGYTVIGCTSRYGGDMGFSMSNCTHAKLIGNTSEYNTTGGIVASTGCSFWTITGNTCMNNGQNWDGHAPGDDSRFGIGASSASNGTIDGNAVGDDQTTATQSYGVRLEFGGDNITISANTYKGNKLAAFWTDGLATNVTNIDAAAGGDVFGKRAAYSSVTAAATATITAINTWTAFAGAPTITLPNDGGKYRIDLDGTDAAVNPATLLSLGLSGDGGATFIKQSTHNHTTTNKFDRVHLAAGNVTGSGQAITVWAQASAASTATLDASGSSPLELWATRVA